MPRANPRPLLEAQIALQARATLLGEGLAVENGDHPQGAGRDRPIPAAGEEVGRRLVEQRPRVIPADARARVVAVTKPRLRIEVRAVEDERLFPVPGLHQLEAVDHPLPPEKSRARGAQVPDGRVGADRGRFAAARAAAAFAAELEPGGAPPPPQRAYGAEVGLEAQPRDPLDGSAEGAVSHEPLWPESTASSPRLPVWLAARDELGLTFEP